MSEEEIVELLSSQGMAVGNDELIISQQDEITPKQEAVK